MRKHATVLMCQFFSLSDFYAILENSNPSLVSLLITAKPEPTHMRIQGDFKTRAGMRPCGSWLNNSF